MKEIRNSRAEDSNELAQSRTKGCDHASKHASARVIGARKADHIRICLEEDVAFTKKTGFEQYEFQHNALPDLRLDDIETSTRFLGRKFLLPFFIEAMTGGTPLAEKINKNLARAAEAMGIGMGLGSQRAMLKDPGLVRTYQVREEAPNILLMGNIGASQLLDYGVEDIVKMVRQVEADGVAVHLNSVQEMSQYEGDTDWRNVLRHIEQVCRNVPFPVIVKEAGCGISGEVCSKLEAVGVSCVDVAGAGGTCFAKVEHHRGSKTADAFFEWGMPTAECLRQCKEAVKIPIIASGGIRSGVDCAKAIALGASLVGFAFPLLKPALESHEAVAGHIEQFAAELTKSMLLVGASNLDELRQANISMK